MSGDLAERRKSRLMSLYAVAAAMIAIAAVTLGIEARSTRPNQSAGAVLPQLAQTFEAAKRIRVVSREASYDIENTEHGWVMRDPRNYPVEQARIDQFKQALTRLQFVRRMTADPERHARLGVDDPRDGGRGVLVQIERGKDSRALLVDLIFGIEPGGRVFARRAAEEQVWEVRGAENEPGLPPLRDIAAWLNLRPLDLQAEQLLRAEIVPAEGRAYVLARPEPGQPWRIASPALDAASQAIVTQTAEQMLRLTPVDVVEAPAAQGPARARLRVVTRENLAIEGELVESQGRLWLKLVARALSPEQEAAALALNEEIAGWAYGLSQADAAALAPALATLLPAPGGPSP